VQNVNKWAKCVKHQTLAVLLLTPLSLLSNSFGFMWMFFAGFFGLALLMLSSKKLTIR
jgi:hypothetical protein